MTSPWRRRRPQRASPGQAALREGDRDIWALALEFSFPVLKNLEIGASVRYDDYSDFGSTTNPKSRSSTRR